MLYVIKGKKGSVVFSGRVIEAISLKHLHFLASKEGISELIVISESERVFEWSVFRIMFALLILVCFVAIAVCYFGIRDIESKPIEKPIEYNVVSNTISKPRDSVNKRYESHTHLREAINNTLYIKSIYATEEEKNEIEGFCLRMGVYNVTQEEALAAYTTLRSNIKDPHTHKDAILNASAAIRTICK